MSSQLITTRRRARVGLVLLYVGAALTVLVGVLPFTDLAQTLLADHIAAGYPSYPAHDIGAAVSAYVAILVTVAGLGLIGWGVSLFAAHRNSRATRPLLAVILALGLLVGVSALTIQDTSGDVGLAPALGWLLLLPVVPGVAALATWKRTV